MLSAVPPERNLLAVDAVVAGEPVRIGDDLVRTPHCAGERRGRVVAVEVELELVGKRGWRRGNLCRRMILRLVMKSKLASRTWMILVRVAAASGRPLLLLLGRSAVVGVAAPVPALDPPLVPLPRVTERRRRRGRRHQMLSRNVVRRTRLGRHEEGCGRRRHFLAPSRRQQYRGAGRPPRPSAVLLLLHAAHARRPSLSLDHHRSSSGKAAAERKHTSISHFPSLQLFSLHFLRKFAFEGQIGKERVRDPFSSFIVILLNPSFPPVVVGRTRLSPKIESDSADLEIIFGDSDCDVASKLSAA